MDKKIYKVYLLTFPNNKKYCGYTSQELKNRWNNGRGYDKCPLVHRAIEKYGWENIKKELIFSSLIQQEAYDKEKETIKLFKLTNPKYGYNLDEGGRPHGNSTFLTEKGRKKISETHKRLWATPEYRAMMIEKAKQHPFPEEIRRKGVQISADLRRGKIALNARPVLQIDIETNNIIKEFPSASHASLELIGEKAGCSNILKVCKKQRHKAYGFRWRFKDENE